MEPGKVQKNATFINDIKDICQKIDELRDRITSRYNAESTNRASNMLRYAKCELQDRLVELGMVIKMEDGKNE